MMTVIMVFIAISFGLLLFSSLQDKIPDELSFLRAGPGSATKIIPGAKVQEYKGWKITQVGTALEVTKEFNGPLMVEGISRSAPTIGILCNDNKLDARIQSHEQTTGVKSTNVSLNGGLVEEWQKGASTNLFPLDTSAFVRNVLNSRNQFQLTLSYKILGAQTSVLEVAGLPEIMQRFPANCRP
jgi:hypothetical protein